MKESTRQALAVLTSGGDAPGMNAAIRAVVRSAAHYGCQVYGVWRGYEGLLQGDWEYLQVGDVGDIVHRGGTMLHSARCPDFVEEAAQRQAIAKMRAAGIAGLVVIGGDGTLMGGYQLGKLGFPVVGIPGTIDNDVVGTELSIGFDTAVNTAVSWVDRIRDTAMSHERTFLIEVMGRTAGFIALWVGIAVGAESILVPEESADVEQVIDRLRRGVARGKKYSIIIVAEGAGRALDISRRVEQATGWETRVSVLGHVQRGGNPSALDRLLAGCMGAKAVEMLNLTVKRSGMVALQRGTIVEAPWPAVCTVADRDGGPKLYPQDLPSLVQLAQRLSI